MAVRFFGTREGLPKEEMTPKRAVGLHLSHHLQRAACKQSESHNALLTFSHCSDRSRPIKAPPGEAVGRPWREAEPMTGSGMRPLDLPCGEQGKLLPPKKFILPERDINNVRTRKTKELLHAGAQQVE